MGLKEYFKDIIPICYQNEDEDGPIASSLTAMSPRDSSGNPVSLIGSDVAKLIKARGVWVLFFPNGGDINDGPGLDASEKRLYGSGIERLMGTVWTPECVCEMRSSKR